MSPLSWFFLLLTIFCWGISPILEKSALRQVAPLDGLFIRSIGVFIIFLLFFVPTKRYKVIFEIPFKSIVLFVISGTLAGFLGMYFYFHVLRANPSSKTVPLAAIYPLVTAILGILLLKEDLSWQRIVGTILIVFGVLLVR